ncbi:MAG: VCBS repeat-containing protein, partial [Planctomycetaceae bacterium]|nr:VCBS repeat-containing protein [Planctomycetaceae bacterium]
GTDGTTELASFFAYHQDFTGGVFVAVADLNGDNHADIITGAGPGGGPHVRVFSGMDGSELFSFFAYNSGFTGGVHVAAGDITNDGIPDIITAAGQGGGPHVRVFDGATPQTGGVAGTDMGGPLGSFFAYDDSFTGGVFIATGDVDGDGRVDIVTSPGETGGPHVKVFGGLQGTTLNLPIGNFFAYDSDFKGGVRVAVTDINDDGMADVITVPGKEMEPELKVFDASTSGTISDDPETLSSRNSAEYAEFTGGLFVGAGTFFDSVVEKNLRLADGFAPSDDAVSLTPMQAQIVFDAALTRLEMAGLSAVDLADLSNLSIEVTDLPGNRLGQALPGIIRIDHNAAGVGWFVDSTPFDDNEYDPSTLKGLEPASIGGVDLLTVILHELAHELGGVDLDASEFPEHLLADRLEPGQRRLP